MKLKINLSGYIGHGWYIKNDIYTVGYAFIDDHHLNTETLHSEFEKVNTKEAFIAILSKLNGEFSVIINHKSLKCFAVNHTRKYPLLYSVQDGVVYVQDHAPNEFKLNNEQVSIFQELFTTEGNHTLFEGWSSLIFNQLAAIEGTNFTVDSYRNYFSTTRESHSLDKIDSVLTRVFSRYSQLFDNKNIFLTLSGGYDSRLVLCKLLEFVPKNKITCFTYGNKESEEVKTAMAVAKRLSVKHIFIEYNEEIFASFFSNSFKNYTLRNHFGTQLPAEQNYYALHYLKENNLVPDDAVFINGIYGDTVAGSGLKASKIDNIENYIQRNHLIKSTSKFSFSNNLDNYENWRYENRAFKFLSSVSATFESFGYTVFAPLGDNEWITLLSSLNHEDRINSNLYVRFIFEKYFEQNNVAFKRSKPTKIQFIKNLIRNKIPTKIIIGTKEIKKQFIATPANNNYAFLYDKVYSEINSKKIKDYNFNKLYVEYLLKLLEDFRLK